MSAPRIRGALRAASRWGHLVPIVTAFLAAILCAVLAYLLTADSVWSAAEARTYFGVMLAFLPLVLIALVLQARPGDVERAEREVAAARRLVQQAGRARKTPDPPEVEAQPRRIDEPTGTRNDRTTPTNDAKVTVEGRDPESRSPADIEPPVDVSALATRLEVAVRRMARLFMLEASAGGIAVMLALFGYLRPTSVTVTLTFTLAVFLTWGLLNALVEAHYRLVRDRERDGWAKGILVAGFCAAGVATGMLFHIRVV